MAAVPSEGTSLERAFASAMWASGIRGWRRHRRVGTTRPDFVFGRYQVAVFVDGCFWHGCSLCNRRPATNTDYWDRKIQRNMDRDHEQAAALRQAGWCVVRVWGHELVADPAASVERVAAALRCQSEPVDSTPVIPGAARRGYAGSGGVQPCDQHGAVEGDTERAAHREMEDEELPREIAALRERRAQAEGVARARGLS